MYDHESMEERWRERWEKENTYKTEEDKEKKTYYALAMFPYPSGEGLHMGHARTYIGADIHARMKRMLGYRVLHPMGWDAFGLPAEEYAIKNKKNPRETTNTNIQNFKKQCKALALSYDWDREINTTDPNYYQWTQWIFLQIYKQGLAYESNKPVNWCPSCKTGLANEDLENGTCERCGTTVEKKPIRQWVLRIREYADRLLNDLETLNEWPESVKEIQRNWIGRSEGYTIPFKTKPTENTIEVFTTRPDTLFGCAFLAMSPESDDAEKLVTQAKNKKEAEKYQKESSIKKVTEIEKEQTGVCLEGVTAIHPITEEEIPVYLADYVLSEYGTGTVFGSPAHDERDFAFAKKYNLPIKEVIAGEGPLPRTETAPTNQLINSEQYDGTPAEEAKKILAKAAKGKKTVSYRLQDWVFSRQRYWGEPIPIIHCKSCGAVPVPENDLPVELPEIDAYEPTGTGESPLAAIEDWVQVPCPKCKEPGKRETNTMPQWAGSSWYHLRYLDPKNKTAIADKEGEKEWMPVDRYTGGMEHAARHLIYARFWHKVLYDRKIVSTDEPYKALETVGIVQAEGGGKMSKRIGNVVDPIAIAKHIGIDAVRVYVAHMAPFSGTVAWDSKAIAGARRFLERVQTLKEKIKEEQPDKEILQKQHETVLSVTNDIEKYRFNTAISSLMILTNALQEKQEVPKETYETLLKLLAPFAPYLTEEIWHELGNKNSIHTEPFPKAEEKLAQKETVTVAVQVKGKTRGEVKVRHDSEQEEVLKEIEKDERLATYTKNLTVKAYIKNKIISFI